MPAKGVGNTLLLCRLKLHIRIGGRLPNAPHSLDSLSRQVAYQSCVEWGFFLPFADNAANAFAWLVGGSSKEPLRPLPPHKCIDRSFPCTPSSSCLRLPMCLLCSIAAPTFIALYLTANTARCSLQAPSHLPHALAHLTPIIYQSTFFFSRAFARHFLLLVFVAPEKLTLPRDFFLIHVLHWPMGCAV